MPRWTHLLMLGAGAAAGAGWDLKCLCGVEELLLRVDQLGPPDVVVALCGLPPPLAPLQPGGVAAVVVVLEAAIVGVAIGLAFVMLALMTRAVAIAVLVRTAVGAVLVEIAVTVIRRLLRVQWGLLALRRGAVLPHLVDK